MFFVQKCKVMEGGSNYCDRTIIYVLAGNRLHSLVRVIAKDVGCLPQFFSSTYQNSFNDIHQPFLNRFTQKEVVRVVKILKPSIT